MTPSSLPWVRHPWHGRNLDAISESIGSGQINEVEISYRLIINNYDKAGADAKETMDGFERVIRFLAGDGYAVDIEINGKCQGGRHRNARQRLASFPKNL